MRVLAVGNRDPFTVTGGYERIFRSTVERLRREGDEVRVLTPPELRWYGDDAGGWRRPSWRERRAIERHNRALLAEARADVVLWWGMGGLPLSILEAVGAPAVGVVGDGWMVYGLQVDPWSKVAPGSAAHWIFVSRYALERSVRAGHRLPDASVAHPGVDPARFPYAPPGPWRGRLAYIGRVAPGKGVETARAAVARLPGTTLVADGPGGDVHTPAEQVHEAYAAADAVLFPVEWPEPWGLVPLEAMSVGRPVIATGTGGSGEYLRDGVNCLLVPPGDPTALAAAVERLAGDAGLRAQLVAGGRATAARYPQDAFEAEVIARARAAASRGRAPAPAIRGSAPSP